MRTKRLLKRFDLEEWRRPQLELGPSVRLVADQHRVELVETAGAYPTGPDLYVKTWVTEPGSWRQWLGFEPEVTHGKVDGSVVTSLAYRLTDGTDQFWWNGSAWVVNSSSWNTEAEVANNLSAFASRKLGFVVNLQTSDEGYTPKLHALKVVWASTIEFMEDLIYRSLVRTLRREIRPIAEHPFVVTATSATLDLADTYKPETPYNIVAVDSVFDHTNDPDHLVDLFDSFDENTKLLTLSSPLAAGDACWLRFVYEPEVAVTTSSDFTELAKVPALVLDDIDIVETKKLGGRDWVMNRSAGTGVKFEDVMQADVEVELQGITDKGVDQQRLGDELRRFFSETPLLISTGLDEQYSLWLIDEYDMRASANRENIHAGLLRFRIRDVLLPYKGAQDVFMVSTMKFRGDMSIDVTE